MLNEYPFTFKADSVKILDGADEGSFAWVGGLKGDLDAKNYES